MAFSHLAFRLFQHLSYPYVLGVIHDYGVFWVFATLSFSSFLFIDLFLPETKDKSLEEIEMAFQETEPLFGQWKWPYGNDVGLDNPMRRGSWSPVHLPTLQLHSSWTIAFQHELPMVPLMQYFVTNYCGAPKVVVYSVVMSQMWVCVFGCTRLWRTYLKELIFPQWNSLKNLYRLPQGHK